MKAEEARKLSQESEGAFKMAITGAIKKIKEQCLEGEFYAWVDLPVSGIHEERFKRELCLLGYTCGDRQAGSIKIGW
ncbi:hypothetical protein [Pedobacter africanus]|uniref:Uncharacterized protein n=1 Tax=Pedobacter africanus TaxID=151894 RepID=A0A1W1ZC32_9SPHI|nr:hypothetical protein [Pedobacter africanus]SMC45965.1 hypothetical protein SAMN04488524_0584 [Pedobacter africanus]